MAQIGSFVPAKSATIGLADRLFARIGASDEIHSGQSTFMVEMTETANILNNATDRSLVILDEIGRGTSTLDGLSLAWAIAEHIALEVKSRTLFATHYHELTDLAQRIKGVRNLNVAVREWEDQVVFLHRIVEGGTDRSYGIHVARLAGVPRRCWIGRGNCFRNWRSSMWVRPGSPRGCVRKMRPRWSFSLIPRRKLRRLCCGKS